MHNEHKTAAAGILLLLAGIFAATTVPSLVFACSLLPEKRTEAEQIRDADLILKGVVGKTIVTESDYKNSRQYIHELETQLTVTKTYKGPADLSTITVHVSASPETRCPFVDFRTQNGKEVTIKLRVDPKTKRLFADLRPEIKDTAALEKLFNEKSTFLLYSGTTTLDIASKDSATTMFFIHIRDSLRWILGWRF